MSILINYAASMTTAIRNSQDESDPNQEFYREQIILREEAFYDKAHEYNLSYEQAHEILEEQIKHDCVDLLAG